MAVQQHYASNAQLADPGQLYELIHFVLFLAAFVSWCRVGALVEWPWTFGWLMAFIFCGIIHRLIVADVTHMDSAKWYRLLDSLVLIVAVSTYEIAFDVPIEKSMMNSPSMVYGIFVYVLVFWTNYVVRVIDEITSTLDIRLFVITPPKQKKK